MAQVEAPLIEPAVLERALGKALGRGGEFAEIFVEDRRSTGVSLDDRKVEEVSSGRDRGAGIRVVLGDTTGFAHTADLSESGLHAAAEAAAAVARSGGPGVREIALEGRSVPSPSSVEIYPETITKTAKVELLLRADEAARASGAAIVQVSAGYGDSRRRIMVANSDGLLSFDDQVRTRLSVMCVALEVLAGMQTGYETAAFTVGFELFDKVSVEETARDRCASGPLEARRSSGAVGRSARRY